METVENGDWKMKTFHFLEKAADAMNGADTPFIEKGQDF